MFYLFIFILGLIIGSFLNVVILRLHAGEKIAAKHSRCPHCRHELAPKDLIPVLSFLIQLGKCRYCRQKISWQYPLVELATGFLFVAFTYSLLGNLSPALLFYGANFWLLVRNLIFVSFLVIIFVYDWRWYLILDKVTLPAMAVALVLNLFFGFGWKNLLVAAVIGLAFFGLQFLFSKGKWIGGGDLRLGVLMGLMLGWPNIIVGIFFAYVVGAVVAVPLVALGKKEMKSMVPLGTFLAIGTIVALLWGEQIVGWYIGLM